MPDSFPNFRFHPDPLQTGSVEASATCCVVCDKPRGFIYAGPTFGEFDLDEQICPWCIADGSAHKRYEVTFLDEDGVGGYGDWCAVPEATIVELATRTPCFSGWQQERWFTCCGDGTVFLGLVGKSELEAFGPTAIEAIRLEAGYDENSWKEYFEALTAEGSPTAYLFRCPSCQEYGGYSDCD